MKIVEGYLSEGKAGQQQSGMWIRVSSVMLEMIHPVCSGDLSCCCHPGDFDIQILELRVIPDRR